MKVGIITLSPTFAHSSGCYSRTGKSSGADRLSTPTY
jgi:hypothetical protein